MGTGMKLAGVILVPLGFFVFYSPLIEPFLPFEIPDRIASIVGVILAVAGVVALVIHRRRLNRVII